MIRIAISLAAYQAIGSTIFLTANRIKMKRALFNEIATSGDGARDGRLPLRIDQTNVPPAGSNGSGSARAVPRLCRGRSASPHRLQRQSGDQSLVAAALPGLRRPLRGLQSLRSHQLRTEQHRARRWWPLNGDAARLDHPHAGLRWLATIACVAHHWPRWPPWGEIAVGRLINVSHWRGPKYSGS